MVARHFHFGTFDAAPSRGVHAITYTRVRKTGATSDDVPIAFESRALGNPTLRLNDLLRVNHQLRRLAALIRTRTALILLRAPFPAPILFGPLIHFAGLEARALLAALEDANLILQQCNLFFLLLYLRSQPFDHPQ